MMKKQKKKTSIDSPSGLAYEFRWGKSEQNNIKKSDTVSFD